VHPCSYPRLRAAQCCFPRLFLPPVTVVRHPVSPVPCPLQLFNSSAVLAKAFDSDWVAIQRGKGDAFILGVMGMKSDPAGPEILGKGGTLCVLRDGRRFFPFEGLGFSNTTKNPEGILSHNNREVCARGHRH
jgi:hypothetical protein